MKDLSDLAAFAREHENYLQSNVHVCNLQRCSWVRRQREDSNRGLSASG